MKTKILYFFTGLFTLFFCFSCSDDDDSASPSTSVNDFVWKAMNLWYYWQEDVADLSDTRFQTDAEYTQFLQSKSTENLFFSLLNQYGTIDRFSWIVPDYHDLENQFAGINKSFGMKYGLVYLNSESNQIFGYLQYVIPNSPAWNAGLKRGDIFNSINGINLTDSNYNELLAQPSADFGMAYLENGQLFNLNQTISIQKTVIQENPVYLTKIIETNGHKIGYLLYNGFRANFNSELNDAFGELKAAGITDLIVDLRYNGGGSVETSVLLGSMITGQFENQTFTQLTFNEKASQNNSNYKFRNEGKAYDNDLNLTGTFPINHLNLNQLIVLTSRNTASASEMLISCLRPYIQVSTIGLTTYGKTVGSITLYDSPSSSYTSTNKINTSHTWAMQPIVFEYKDSQNQPSPIQGILPETEINEIHYLEDLPALGDTNEPLLAQALAKITGISKVPFPSFNYSATNFFKSSQDLEKFGTEMYLNKGYYPTP
ncbi:MAG: S41 family peptidase [Weeksellaceae bacterium]|jgi:C-terminal processing protease CtpA/Prc|nr:S41 family peptidase [Weeksellaceae bacterium]MDX9705243.1 S41 family peptidase [Weeksellaceae bacterium]